MRINADLRYSNEEGQLVRDYLKANGIKHGPYLQAKLLREAQEWKRLLSGSTQVDMEALRGGRT